jgi:hypothetical protein
MTDTPKKPYWTVLKNSGTFNGQPRYYGTFDTEAEVLAHFQGLPGFQSLEVNADNPEFRTLTVRFQRVLFPTETYFYREAEYDGFVKADLSELEARVLGHAGVVESQAATPLAGYSGVPIDHSTAPANWAHGQAAKYPNRKRTERYEK